MQKALSEDQKQMLTLAGQLTDKTLAAAKSNSVFGLKDKLAEIAMLQCKYNSLVARVIIHG